jgi:hypothetical protein
VIVSVAGVPGVMDVGDTVTVSCGSKDEATRLTEFENPSIGFRLIVDVPELPAMTVTGSGLADTEKSGPITRMPTNAVWVRAGELLVPFTSTV